MMEPSNIDLQHQQEFHGSSPLAASHFHPLESNHEWSQNLMFSRIRTSIENGRKPGIHSPMGLSLENGGNIIQDINGVLSSPRDFRLSYETTLLPLSTPMVQDLGFLWSANAEAYVSHPTHQPPIAQIKGELSDSSATEDYHLPPQQAFHLHQLEDKLLMRTRTSGCQMNGIQPPAGAGDLLFQTPSLASFGEAPTYGRGNYNMVLPSTNISSSSPQPSSFPSSIGMDLQALQLLASERFRKTFSQPSANSIPFLREYVPYGLAHLQELSQGTSNNHLKVPTLLDGVPETKRPNSLLEQKTSQAAPKKQPRLESRSSFSPFKVRKEKLGDRIAALQQLVAPFGKTDTASVLMEAIGYIKFLQDQVETLSVPYMRSSGNKKLRTTRGEASEETNEPKLDLRSRGLCLVPLSCTSYVTNDNGGLWSPPNFRGGT